MGVEASINYDRFPKQTDYLHRRARVCFFYQSRDVWGTIVRSDAEAPWRTIIKLDDTTDSTQNERYVLATECMYSPEATPPPTEPATRRSEWQPIATAHPEPHAKYLVRRNGLIFTATPCYGMHEPWWVVRTMADKWPNECEPEPMRNTDDWQPLPAAPVSPATKDGQP